VGIGVSSIDGILLTQHIHLQIMGKRVSVLTMKKPDMRMDMGETFTTRCREQIPADDWQI
jgi:hypothetical protein